MIKRELIHSALFRRYVPADIFGKLFQKQKGFGVLMAAAFMITGPATK